MDVFGGSSQLLKQRKPDIILECFHADHCEAITAATRPLGYRYYKIEEDGFLTARDQLEPASTTSDSLNQLLTTEAQPAEFLGPKK